MEFYIMNKDYISAIWKQKKTAPEIKFILPISYSNL